MRRISLSASAAVALFLIQPAHAALNFDFSFSNAIGNVSGSVTGEIFGLADNTSGQAATDIEVDSYPTGLTGLPSAPFDAFTVPGTNIVSNSFTVSGGQITAASFDTSFIAFSRVLLALDYTGVNGLQNSTASAFVINSNGFAGATYTSAPVPEPASIVLLLSGMFGLGAIRRQT